MELEVRLNREDTLYKLKVIMTNLDAWGPAGRSSGHQAKSIHSV